MLTRTFSIKRTVFTGLLLLVALAGALSLYWVRSKAFYIVADTLPGLSDAGIANADTAEDCNFILLALLASTPEEKAKFLSEASQFEAEAAKYLNLYEKSIFMDEDRANFRLLTERRREFMAIRTDILALMDRHNDQEALSRYKQQLLPSYTQYMTAANGMLDYNVRLARVRGQSIMQFSHLAEYTVAGFTIALFLLGLAFSIFKYSAPASTAKSQMTSRPAEKQPTIR